MNSFFFRFQITLKLDYILYITLHKFLCISSEYLGYYYMHIIEYYYAEQRFSLFVIMALREMFRKIELFKIRVVLVKGSTNSVNKVSTELLSSLIIFVVVQR